MSSEQQHNLTFIDALKKLFQALMTLKEEFVQLVKLELRLAGKSLVLIIVFYVAIAFFFISAWFFILAALAALLVAMKFSWVVALFAVAGFNFLLIILAVLLIARYKHYLTFPATRRQLKLYGGDHEIHHGTTNEENSRQ